MLTINIILLKFNWHQPRHFPVIWNVQTGHDIIHRNGGGGGGGEFPFDPLGNGGGSGGKCSSAACCCCFNNCRLCCSFFCASDSDAKSLSFFDLCSSAPDNGLFWACRCCCGNCWCAGSLGLGFDIVAAANCCGVKGGLGCLCCGCFWTELCPVCLELLGFMDGFAKSFLLLVWPWSDPSLFDDGNECFDWLLDDGNFFTSSAVVFLEDDFSLAVDEDDGA